MDGFHLPADSKPKPPTSLVQGSSSSKKFSLCWILAASLPNPPRANAYEAHVNTVHTLDKKMDANKEKKRGETMPYSLGSKSKSKGRSKAM